MDPREAERFEEGLDSEYHDATEDPQDSQKPDQGHVFCFSHGSCGSSSLPECLDLLNQTRSNSPAALHSGVKTEKLSDPLQVMSPNVEEEQTSANGPASGSISEGQPLPKDEPQSRSEHVKEEVATPKSEPTALEPKEESAEQGADDQNSNILREELQRSRDAFPPHDSEDSLGPEHVADELRRLIEAHAQMTGSASIVRAHMHLRDQEEIEVDQCPLIHLCFSQLSGWSMIRGSFITRYFFPQIIVLE